MKSFDIDLKFKLIIFKIQFKLKSVIDFNSPVISIFFFTECSKFMQIRYSDIKPILSERKNKINKMKSQGVYEASALFPRKE